MRLYVRHGKKTLRVSSLIIGLLCGTGQKKKKMKIITRAIFRSLSPRLRSGILVRNGTRRPFGTRRALSLLLYIVVGDGSVSAHIIIITFVTYCHYNSMRRRTIVLVRSVEIVIAFLGINTRQ